MKLVSLYKKIKRPSLANNFFLIILIVAIAMISGATWFSYYIYQDQSRQNILTLRAVSKKIERVIIDDFEYTKYQMEYVSNQIKQKGDDQDFIRELLGTFRVSTKVQVAISWNMFSWMNEKKFITIDGTEGILKHPRDLSKRDYIPNTIKHPGELYIGKPVYGAVSKQWIIPAGMGVTNKNNKFVGAVVFGFNIGSLISKLENVTGNEGIHFAILNNKNEMVAKSSSFAIEKKELDKLIEKKPLNSVLSIQSIFRKGNGFMVSQEVEGYPLRIIVQFDNRFSYYKFWHEWRFYMMQFMFALIFVTLFLYILKIRIIKPVTELSKAAKLVSRGEVDVKIPHYNGIEANSLATALINIKRYIKREIRLKDQIKQAEILAKEVSSSKTKFLKATSHDLKNYIVGISGLAHMVLESKSRKSKEDFEDIKLIAKQSEELMHFVEDLMDISQVETGEFSLGRLEDCNLAELVQRIILLNKTLFIRNQITVETKFDEDLPPLRCDVRRIKQIISNLITNAVKYSMSNTVVTIAVSYLKGDKQVLIEIVDQGIGMSEDEVAMALLGEGEKINKHGLNKVIDSHGVGMPIVKKLVELHHGRLEIDSKPGNGTKVRIYFNLIDKDAVQNASKKTILIVDDQRVNLLVTKGFIEKNLHGIICEIAEDGNEALKMAKKNKYDLILMDIEMPVMDGITATRRIRKFDLNTPIIAYTSLKNIRKEVLDAGLNDYLKKTRPDVALIRTICKWAVIRNEVLTKDAIGVIKAELKNKRILLADDETTNLLMLSRYLENLGVHVDQASNGQELYNHFLKKGSKYDLIITDVNMPIMSGYEAAKKIRQHQRENKIRHVPIIAYSGDDDKEKLYLYLNSGIDDYFIKGYNNEFLLRLIVFWITRIDVIE